MRSFRIGCANWGSPFLIALVPLFVLLIVACDDRDGGFKEDPRVADQAAGPAPDDGGFREDPRIADQAAGPAPDIEPTPEIQEGRLPGRTHGDRAHGIWPQVWSQHAPSVQSWEYKVNCGDASTHEEACFLSDLTSVVVITPAGELIELEKDFNTNDFSGEVTRRWVLYGPDDGNLPARGDYVFSYWRAGELVYEQVVPYDSDVISYPTEVTWNRTANDIEVRWAPPAEAANGMHYKAIIWHVDDTPELFISEVFDWNVDTAVLRDVPMIEGGKYSLNVALFFDDGYAYSDYIVFEWPGTD
ncbi:MAG: hypothetical protein J4N63_07730 [Chloroflexi bacterium]|nr:hypothetical protein [Chloroflexota bacterium]